jgi:proteasome accessory factor PafA2
MSVHRVMGIETEYGISTPSDPTMNPMVASTHIVNSYAQLVASPQSAHQRWDYAVESPLRDARGFDQSRADADPSQLTDDDLGLANVILTNGARLYVDHAHPEYSSPEVTNPRDAVLWDRAGELVMERAAAATSLVMGGQQILLYKNNTDNKGASYGCHENYLMKRSTPFADIVKHLIPFFITRQIFTGSGRLGVGQDGASKVFQLSQRADFFEVEVGLETTLKRPIINTRDEPHADPEKYRRLHVIVGDANLSEVATYLKMGTTSIVLAMIEEGALADCDLMPADPVREMHRVSHDVTLSNRLLLNSGEELTALEIQYELLGRAEKFCSERPDYDVDLMTKDVLARWRLVLDQLSTDPQLAAKSVDWAAKYALMTGYINRDALTWEDPRLQLIDLQYSDLRPGKGLAKKLMAAGRLDKIVDESEVVDAVGHPPSNTRAYFRGECMRRYPESVAAASWDSIVFDLDGHEALLRVPTLEPTRGTKEHVGALLDACASAEALVAALVAE